VGVGGGEVLQSEFTVERPARNALIPVSSYELEVMARALGLIVGPMVRGRLPVVCLFGFNYGSNTKPTET